jgi:2-methylcitrate dehydratase PrpD
MIAGLGQVHFLESPGMGLKWHPCSAPQFLAADATLHLKREHNIRYEDVAKMEVNIPPLRYARHYALEVKTGLRGKFAINYVVAMCILDGKLELATFTNERVNQSQVQEAFSKVQVNSDESIPEPGPYCPVSVELKNGTKLSYTAKVAKGHPDNPMSESEVLDKFRGNAKLAIAEQQTEAVISAVNQLESVGKIKSIVELLTL